MDKWIRLKSELEILTTAQISLSPYTFLKPSQCHNEIYKRHEILVFAEDEAGQNGVLCLVIDRTENVYCADMHSFEILNYCNHSLSQFITIAERYTSFRHQMEDLCQRQLQEQEKKFRNFINQIDPTALEDENNFWSLYAEEMGYGL